MKIQSNIILMAVVVVLAFLLLRQCNKDFGSTEVIKTVVKTDTLIVKGKPDTITLEKVKVVHEYLPITIVDTFTIDGTTTYTTPINDSLITGEIKSEVKGELKNIGFSYTPKFPKYIIRTDTFKIENETTITRNPYRFYVGGVLGGNANSFVITPSLMLKTPKKLAFSVGYDLVNKTYQVGAFTEISFKH